MAVSQISPASSDKLPAHRFTIEPFLFFPGKRRLRIALGEQLVQGVGRRRCGYTPDGRRRRIFNSAARTANMTEPPTSRR
jgi:hypothetical protein